MYIKIHIGDSVMSMYMGIAMMKEIYDPEDVSSTQDKDMIIERYETEISKGLLQQEAYFNTAFELFQIKYPGTATAEELKPYFGL